MHFVIYIRSEERVLAFLLAAEANLKTLKKCVYLPSHEKSLLVVPRRTPIQIRFRVTSTACIASTTSSATKEYCPQVPFFGDAMTHKRKYD